MKLNWAILATGGIARKFAAGIRACDNGNLVAVGSRDLARAQAFCGEFGGKPYDDYDAAIEDPAVEAVYIALPHHLHTEYTIRCAKAGKHVLCEKPFALNAEDAARALAEVDREGVFFMEAWMYRSHPQTIEAKRLVADGAIGTVRVVRAEFGFQASREWSNFRTVGEVGGGALMDVGSYPVSFARRMVGAEPVRAEYAAEITPQGYDAVGAGVLEFPGGVVASFGTAIHLNLENAAVVYGDEGRLVVPSPWFCSGELRLHRNGKEPETIQTGTVPDLWGNQAAVVARHLAERESPTMTKADTLGNMRALDALRRSAGLRFGGDPW
ncbi:MAG: Gfo/Idh/MocA family oxidoreductase [Fimbriimonadaceae bacterium]|nr:Gfo/Idh/MocA family oxidoreductase [Fimbriimonadaceae bacterium]